MSRRVLRITAILLLIATAVVVGNFIIRQRVRLVSRSDRQVASDVRVTQLTVQIGRGRVDLTAVVLPADRFRVSLLDQPERDPTHARLLANFGDAVVAITGGYFDEQFEPVGLYVLDGREISPLTTRSPLSAVVAVDAAGRLTVSPADQYTGGAHAAIQAGPFVIDPGGAIGVTELAAGRARRTVLAMTAGGDGVVISTSEASLFELAKILSDAPRLIGCGEIERAVNLDGGPSATLLLRGDVTPRPSGGPARNYLVFSLNQ